MSDIEKSEAAQASPDKRTVPLVLKPILAMVFFALPAALMAYSVLILLLWWDVQIPDSAASTRIVPASLADQVNVCMPGTGVVWDMHCSLASFTASGGWGLWIALFTALLVLCLISLIWTADIRWRLALRARPLKTIFISMGAFMVMILATGVTLFGRDLFNQIGVSRIGGVALQSLFTMLVCGLLVMSVGQGGTLAKITDRSGSPTMALVRGCLAGGLIALVLILQGGLDRYTSAYTSVHQMGFSRTMLERTVQMMAFWAVPILSVTGGTLSAFTLQDLSRRQRAASLVAPAMLLLAMGIASLLLVHHARNAWDMKYDSLNEAASLTRPDPPTGPRIAFFLVPSSDIEGINIEMNDEALFCGHETVDYTPENIPRLDAYLNRHHGSPTFYTRGAVWTREEIARRNWMVEELLQMQLQNLNAGYDTSPMVLVNLRRSQVTPGHVEILRKLSIEDEYIAGAFAALQLARAWAAFGDGEQTEKWFERALDRADEKGPPPWERPDVSTFTRGQISGRVVGIDPEGVRVGLFNSGTEEPVLMTTLDGTDATFASAMEGAHVGNLEVINPPQAASHLQPDGSFKFRYLQSGRYTLGLLLPPGASGPFNVDGGGIVWLDEENATADLGTITVAAAKSG